MTHCFGTFFKHIFLCSSIFTASFVFAQDVAVTTDGSNSDKSFIASDIAFKADDGLLISGEYSLLYFIFIVALIITLVVVRLVILRNLKIRVGTRDRKLELVETVTLGSGNRAHLLSCQGVKYLLITSPSSSSIERLP